MAVGAVYIYPALAAAASYLLPNLAALPSCPISVSTLGSVTHCPKSEKEWNDKAKLKMCDILAEQQNCTSKEKFSYHCILNADASRLVEVCAPMWFMTGFCARFSTEEKRIINDPGLDCTTFDNPCPLRYPSTEAYKYQHCYAVMKGKDNRTSNVNTHTCSVVHLPIFWILLVFCFGLLIALIVITAVICIKKRKIKIKETEDVPLMNKESSNKVPEDVLLMNENSSNKAELEDVPLMIEDSPKKGNSPSKEEMENKESDKDDETVEFQRLSGERGRCSIKNIKTVSDLRETLSEVLNAPKNSIWVVQQLSGLIYDDDRDFEDMKNHQDIVEVMVGNSDRTKKDEKLDVISKEVILSKRSQMSCHHITTTDSLFTYTKEVLMNGSTDVRCPKCNKKWKIQEIVEKSAMSKDEELFFKQRANVNKETLLKCELAQFEMTND